MDSGHILLKKHMNLNVYQIHKQYSTKISMYKQINTSRYDEKYKNYSYGCLINIFNTDIIIIDIDMLSRKLFVDTTDVVIIKLMYDYNRASNNIDRFHIIVLYYNIILKHNYKRIELYESSTGKYHLYIILNSKCNTRKFYDDDVTYRLICKGHYAFIKRSGMLNIRVGDKVKDGIRLTDTHIKLIKAWE